MADTNKSEKYNDPAFVAYLEKVGYKPPVYPSFTDWLRDYFDTDHNGKLEKSEKTRYNKAIKKIDKSANYESIYQHAMSTISTEDLRQLERLYNAWAADVPANDPEVTAAADSVKETAARFGATVDEGKKDNKLLIIAAVGVVVLLLLLKKR